MSSLFRPQAGGKGYVTLEDFKKRARATQEKFPELATSALERAERHWLNHCNCGVEMPEGYRLTETQYLQNLWWKIHQPSFEEELRDAAMNFMKSVDKDNKGYFTREEAKKISEKIGRQHPKVKGVFEHLDKENTGRVTFEQSLEAQKFFFLDTEDEDHPFNYVYGPLVD
jgi:hypothetical protein